MTDEAPMVSVIVPARNSAAYIGAALASALEQTYQSIEVVVADDGSTDNTIDLVGELADPRVTVIRGGPSCAAAARNRAIRASSGAFVAFLDSDDVWYPTKLERQMPNFSASEVVAVGALFRFLIGERVLGVRGELVTEERLARVRAARLMPVTFSSLVIRRAALDRVGLFDESLRYGEDLELLARLAADGLLVVLDELLGEYRVHGGGMSRNNQVENQRWIRYIEQRTAVRASGADLSWEAFERQQDGLSRQDKRTDAAARTYQRAGTLYAAGHRFHAAVSLLTAMIQDPRYTVSKLRRQRLWHRSG